MSIGEDSAEVVVLSSCEIGLDRLIICLDLVLKLVQSFGDRFDTDESEVSSLE